MRRHSRLCWIVLAACARDRSGSVLAMTALMLLTLLGFTALAVDVGSWYATQTRMQTATDAAAVAAAMELSRLGYTDSAVIAAAEASATWNGFDPGDGASVAVAIAPDGETVEVVITESLLSAFAGLFVEEPVAIQARAVGGLRPGEPVCLLTLDGSSSSALYLDSECRHQRAGLRHLRRRTPTARAR